MMRLSLRNVTRARSSRPSNTRRTATSRRPSVEEMEGRQLLTVPYMLINSPRAAAGSAAVDFTVTLTSPSAVPVTVQYNTMDGAAKAGVDYTSAAGTLTIAPGQTSATIPVSLLKDPALTQNETFNLYLSSASNASLIGNHGMGLIVYTPPPAAPELAINSVSMTRGLGGTKTMAFTVSLNEPLSYPVTVTASTSGVTAQAGVDYAATTRVLTFNPGVTTQQFDVTIYGTSATVPQKLLYAILSSGSVGISASTGSGIISPGA